MRFRSRQQAGELLADRVQEALDLGAGSEPTPFGPVQVLALPRGGVPVALPIADRLACRLRVLLVRKLGLPGHAELAMGAIAAVGDRVRSVANGPVLRQHAVHEQTWDRVLAAERAELARRAAVFGQWTCTDLPAGTTVVVVDDGLATGATMSAAVAVLSDAGAGRVLVAVPVAAGAAIAALEQSGAEVVVLSRPDPMVAVGVAYRDFHQLDDAEVLALLERR
jgi:putative phosphoribosyl transferase